MFAFDGQFKSRPTVSLGGASKKEARSALLERTQAERRQREDHKKRIQCAVTIQAFVRGEWVRQKQYRLQREHFDVTWKNIENTKSTIDGDKIFQINRKLIFFYSNKHDSQRLIWICQTILKQYKKLIQDYLSQPTRRNTWVYQIKHLMLLCCRSLERSLSNSSPIGVQLRMLEVFSSSDAHVSREDTVKVVTFLVKNKYFACMRALINDRVPSSIEVSSVPPTPLASALVDLVLRPVSLVCSDSMDVTNERHTVLSTMTSDLLTPDMTDQFTCFLLPVLASSQSKLPFAHLVQSILLMHQSWEVRVQTSPWLLYAVLVLAEGHLSSLSIDYLLCYIQVLQLLLPQLPLPASCPDSDDDSDTEMEIQYNKDERLNQLRDECLQILDSKEHVKSLELLVTANISKEKPLTKQQDLILAMCRVCHHLMTENRMQVHKTRLLYSLALNPIFIHQLWSHILNNTITTATGKEIPIIQLIHQGQNLTTTEASHIVPMLSIFSALFSHSLFSVGDKEFFGEQRDKSIMPFTIAELIPMTSVLCDTTIGIIKIIYPDSSHTILAGDRYVTAMKSVGVRSVLVKNEELYPQRKWILLLREVTHLVKQLHSRDTRRQFCPQNHWLSDKVMIDPNQMRIDGFLDDEGTPEGEIQLGMSAMTTRQMSILQHIPFVVPFRDRVLLLQRIIGEDRQQAQGDLHNFMMGPSIDITVRRKYLYQDAFGDLNEEHAPNLKQRVRVRLINDQGLEEAGIDGGGLFREFLNELLKAGFDPNIGFFKATTERLLYPNPNAKYCASNYLQHFRFLGRMLGKALYENMLVELPFAGFFLCKLLGRHGTDVDIHNLESLDPELYKNLLFLKSYEGNVEELALNFTVVNNEFGESQVVELLTNGKDIPVTNSNRILYIHLMADYRLNRQIHSYCQVFRAGLAGVIDLDWLRMFDHQEIQVLISGAQIPVDVHDLKRNTNYSGGFSEEHPCIEWFWQAVESFNDTQKRKLLKFVTSCSRPPLLGFKDLQPAFCVHSAGQEDRLPTASTCMNLLKLPEFPDYEVLREKLLYAIESESGFELS